MEVSIGKLLKEIRIKCGTTLRTFCIGRKLDPARFSLIERDELRPNEAEVNEYIGLVAEWKEKYVISGEVSEELYEEIKNINLELKPFLREASCYCMSCGRVVKTPIYGLFEKRTGALVNIMKGHEEPFVCKACKNRINLLKKE